MGNNSIRDRFESEKISCTDDLMCQNINSTKSKPGKPLVLTCPAAKCVDGTCDCGSKCKRDSYSGMCCSHVEKKTVNGQVNSFCIENFTNNYCNI